MLEKHCNKIKLLWFCCSVVATKIGFRKNILYDFDVDHSLQHVFHNKTEDDDSFWRRCILIWRKFALIWRKVKWWQQKIWMVKLNEQKLLKKTLIRAFFFPVLKLWLDQTFCILQWATERFNRASNATYCITRASKQLLAASDF